ncbi:uncharacterized protein LOC122854000 [Aphidius gifuensis]|uniref:uncharacterized protein LOC122854000 n=1 Tax=Aphidius gifuensis TaxID=684658 RepID=UPI001CDCEE17|nr:uncharacterized protein LOC122854000 [Aphidius gifuensis]
MDPSTNKDKKQLNKNLKWYNYKIITPTISILQGTMSISSKNFKIGSRGHQGVSSSVVAIVFGNLFDPKTWTSSIVNRILEIGDKLYRKSQARNHIKSSEYMTTSQIYPEFFIDDYKARISIEPNLINGNILSENHGSPDLSDGLDNFFKIADAGILTVQGNSFAIWHHKKHGYFYFDSSSCSDNGEKIINGVSCVLRFKNFNDMREFLLNNLNRNYDSRYCIDKITILQIALIKRTISDNCVQKKTVTTFNSDDLSENPMDCTKRVPTIKKKKKIITEIIKEPLTITISNYDIEKKFASDDIIDQSNFDTGYDYYDMEVNIPSTFKELSENVAILHGWTHENSENYKGKGAQNVANCIMAIGMKKIHPVKTWLRPKLDEILVLGDALHAEIKLKKPLIKTMTASDFNDTKIQIEGKNMFVDVDLITVIGTVNSKIPSVLNLKQALDEFFLINKDGIIECPSMSVGVWMQDECYYIFDPKQCDKNGARVIDDKSSKSGGKGKKDTSIMEKKIKGKCCVIRYPNIDNLVDNFIKNLPIGKKNDRFIIRHVSIMHDIPGTRPWNDFKPAEAGKTWILQGTISNDSDIFDDENRGLQGIAMPISGLISAIENQPQNWTKEIIDSCIIEGNEYFNWSIPPDEEQQQDNRQLKIDNLKTTLYNKNRKIKINLQEDCVVGDINATTDANILNLKKGIKKFFDTQNYGIINVKDLTIGIWKFEEEFKDKTKQISYYLFDPYPRNEIGINDLEAMEDELTACVIRSLDSDELARIILENIDVESVDNDNFTIHGFKILSTSEYMTNEEIDIDKKIPIKPDLNGYSELGNDGGILSGSFEQSNVLFKILTRNKQQAANALVTLAMRQMYNPHLWYREVVDDILKLGDKLTQENFKNLPAEQDEAEDDKKELRQYLLPSEIDEGFDIGVNRVTVGVEEDKISGKNVTDITKALEEFFADNNAGILKKDDIIIPIWREGSVYFFFDPFGRDATGEPKENSPASVMWFTNIPSFSSFIVKLFQDKPGIFSIDGVTLYNEYETRLREEERPKKTTSTENLWHNFPKIDEGIWQLKGNISLNDERFEEFNRGKQSAGVALMSVVFSKVYESRQWSADILDEIVITGDKLFAKSIDGPDSSIPRINQIVSEFFLSNRRICLKITDCVEAGNLLGSSNIQNLQSGLDNFFNKFTSGVLTIKQNTNDINIAIWKSKDHIFCVIPNALVSSSTPESDNSFKVTVLRFKNIEIFFNYFKSLLSTSDKIQDDDNNNNNSSQDFEISFVDVIDWNKFPPWKHDPSPAIRPTNLPPLNAYKQLENPARAILQGGIHQGSELFSSSTRNRQTAANCVVSLAMSLIKNPITWTKKILDEILVIGNSVHRESLKITKKEKLLPVDITRIFTIGVNVLTVDVDSSTVSGLVALPPPEPEVKGKGKAKAKKPPKPKKKKGKQKREPPPPPPPIYLEEGLKIFFDNNRAGVLVTGRFMIAIWKEQGVYYYYDPRARNNVGLADDDGVSCVLWFACIEPFYDLVYANIDVSEKYGKYNICRVVARTNLIEPLPCPAEFEPFIDCPDKNIPISSFDGNKVALDVEQLSSFNIVDDDVAVLNGNFSMFDRIFNANNRGFQSTAMSVISIVVGLVHIPSTWTDNLIDFILKYGDILHNDSVRYYRTGSRNLSPSEILDTFIIGDFKATIHIHQHTVAGILIIDDLQQSLNFFFKNHCAGVLHTANYSVGVMQHYGVFYMFDPAVRNENGDASYNGTACVIKSTDLIRISWIFVTNCNYKIPCVYTLNAVNVLNIKFFSEISNSIEK